MSTTIVPITDENLELVSRAGAKFGMPRSAGWLRRCLFDPTVGDLTSDRIRGHMSIDEKGDVKAMQCYYYQPLYFKQKKFLGGTGALMGADSKYGEELLCVLDRNKETKTRDELGFGNCIVGKRSATVNRKVYKMREPLYRPLDMRICILDWAVFPLAVLGRLHLRTPLISRFVYKAFRPLFLAKNWLSKVFARTYGYIMVECDGFDNCRFLDFWQRFLAGNDGVISSREPKRLCWLFNDSIKAGKVLLVTAEKDDRIYGYALLREKEQCDRPPLDYEIIDICAVGNERKCLMALCGEAVRMASRHNGTKVIFYGSMPNQETWLDPLFKHCIKMVNAPFMYVTRNIDLKESLAQNRGWFFGPFDGERCMGHGGNINL